MAIDMTYGRFAMDRIEKARKSAPAAQNLLDELSSPDLDEGNVLTEVSRGFDALHFLLSDERRRRNGFVENPTEILGRAIWGADVLHAKVDGGYGPPRYLTVAQVLEVAAALQKVDVAALEKVFDVKLMEAKEVYRFGDFDELVELFDAFSEFYFDAASEGEGVVVMAV